MGRGLAPLLNDAAQVIQSVLYVVSKIVLVVLLYLISNNLVRVVLVPDVLPDGVERDSVKGASDRATVGESDRRYVAVNVDTVS